MKLAEIPKILSMLTDEDGAKLSKKQIEAVLDYSKQNNMFAGEAAVALSKESNDLSVTQEQLGAALLQQTTLKAQAAVLDIEKIAKDGTQEAPKWLGANWGNKGVNPPAQNPSMLDGATAAANIGQNITMIANEHPELAEGLKPSVAAASKLAENIAGNVNPPVNREQANELYKEMMRGLERVVEKSGVELKDKAGEGIKLDDFINARRAEIVAGINKRHALSQEAPQQGQGINLNVPNQAVGQGAAAGR